MNKLCVNKKMKKIEKIENIKITFRNTFNNLIILTFDKLVKLINPNNEPINPINKIILVPQQEDSIFINRNDKLNVTLSVNNITTVQGDNLFYGQIK